MAIEEKLLSPLLSVITQSQQHNFELNFRSNNHYYFGPVASLNKSQNVPYLNSDTVKI